MRVPRAAVCLFLFTCVSSLFAANRAFVSGAGIDTSTCAITAPCRSFAYAITQIASGGEIIAVDTAGYGAVNITQAVSIIAAPGVTGFSTAGAGDVIAVNAGAGDMVTLHGITITGAGGTNGVHFVSGKSVSLEACVVNGNNIGVMFTRMTDNSRPIVQIVGCIVRNNATGVYVANVGPGMPAGGPPPNLSIVTVANSAFVGQSVLGINAEDNARVMVADSVFSGNGSGVGSQANADYSYSEINLDRCTFSGNNTGVFAGDAFPLGTTHGVVRLANCMITGNVVGLTTNANGSSLSRLSNSTLTNTIEGNSTDGTPTGTYSAK